MSLRLIEVTAKAGHLDTLRAIADKDAVATCKASTTEEGGCSLTILAASQNRQSMLDQMQTYLGTSDGWRIVVLPVEAAVPPLEAEDKKDAGEKPRPSTGQTREELYTKVETGARAGPNFLLLVVLSTIVAAIGLITDNVAVVIGAMVIAPLLGPNLAFILASAMGDHGLMSRAFRTNLIGVSLALVVSILISFAIPIDLESHELMARTHVGPDGVAIALASGTAAALSLTTGLSSTLVGVMVAVALLPPTATIGMMLGVGRYDLALGAAFLLAVNVVSVNLSGQVVFLIKGVRPRTWLEKRSARQSVALNIVAWVIGLAVLSAILYFRSGS